jgi:nucleoid DNA-binding protein
MQVIDTPAHNRAITLKPTEQLNSQRLVAALVHKGSHTRKQAKAEIAHLFDCLEEQLFEQQHVKA